MLKQTLQQRLLQKLSPQQIQLMKMLQLPTLELEQRIKEELEENPALDEGEELSNAEKEEDFIKDEITDQNSRDEFDFNEYINDETPSYKLQSNNQSNTEQKQSPYSLGASFTERLLTQIGLRIKDEKQQLIAKYIIGNLDDSGYLRRELFNIVDDLAFSQNIITSEEELLKALKEVQNLEPAGVGARDLKECLLIQLENSDELAKERKLIIENIELLGNGDLKSLQKITNLKEEVLKDQIKFIRELNPKPGTKYSEENYSCN